MAHIDARVTALVNFPISIYPWSNSSLILQKSSNLLASNQQDPLQQSAAAADLSEQLAQLDDSVDNQIAQTESDSNAENPESQLATRKPKAADSQTGPTAVNDPVAHKFVNCMMYDGKKSLSRRIFNEALEMVKKSQIEKYGSNPDDSNIVMNPMKIFHGAIDNAKPIIGVQTIKRGGKSYQVPIPLKERRRYFLAIKWFITIARSGKENGMSKKLAKEFLNAYNNEGAVVKKKIELHKIAESNRAYAHYRWW
ncbi:uncharacterized protein TRIADDRAFT_53618 [Trichoplax adhaerens]|uniref:Ribosomal protein S7 n=1 Tax=Trichoplax adhaerens TaxID=10228 RepID=B3RPQ0_TRIAD|nr:hypothetical protein TRIADDRAFT_53618 [Trichoplax adhaerens]EDV27677.1 hypothetical protein TRIADDRAFT_53618 [Trichoplax adhaerens]|eukprot:XP_002109511.1 hypothetical protein TRIADDRAFT_53618 [Trichoplax adhaerens]